MDNVTKEKRSEIMGKIRSKRTGPEMLFHGILKGAQVRHQMWPLMAGKPDCLIHPNVAVFVNGCFWHGCRRHWKVPASNSDFWQQKIDRNRKRQRQVLRELRQAGYVPVVIWEHDLKVKRSGKLKA